MRARKIKISERDPESPFLPPSKLQDPVHAYAEELCWRAAVGEVLNTYRLVKKTPGDVGEALRSFLTMRVQAFMEERKLFHVAEDKDIARFATARLKELKKRKT